MSLWCTMNKTPLWLLQRWGAGAHPGKGGGAGEGSGSHSETQSGIPGAVLCKARSWAWWVPSNPDYSMILWSYKNLFTPIARVNVYVGWCAETILLSSCFLESSFNFILRTQTQTQAVCHTIYFVACLPFLIILSLFYFCSPSSFLLVWRCWDTYWCWNQQSTGS